MKKINTLVITAIIIISMFPICAGAYRVGDVTGYALSTDIAASINGYDIPSYNVGGHTYIVVEDLQYYGFSVIYDNASRTLSVTRDLSQEYVSKVYEKPYVSEKNTGKREHKIFYTDIVTYLDGTYVPAQNIGGQTIIRFDSLSAYGMVSYDNYIREISLVLSDISTNPNPVIRANEFLQKIQGFWANGDDFVSFEGRNYADATYCSEYWHEGVILDIQRENNNSMVLTLDCPAKIMAGDLIYPKHVCRVALTSTDGFISTVAPIYEEYINDGGIAYYYYTASNSDAFYAIMEKRKGY